ncbi:MAG: hypothetical protein K0S71_1459 [Clostridia bacterium]|jgi:hypothetical protein|nr:hypothetical protein [Clostridia bacterium]
MRVIIEHDKKEGGYLVQYTTSIENLHSNYKFLDIEEKHLPWLEQIAHCIEPNFTIMLHKEESISEPLLKNHDMLLVTIGLKDINHQIDARYNLKTHTLEQPDTVKNTSNCQWIHCYSPHHTIEVIDYIRCIRYLRDISKAQHRPMVIYANIYVPDEMYRYRALAYKIINAYLGDINGVLITKAVKEDIHKYYTASQRRYEFYLDHIIYLEDTLNNALMKAIPFLYTSQDHLRFKHMYKGHRQDGTLYDDVFYKAIDLDEEIYVPLNLGNFHEPEYYQALGLKHIPLIGDYGMLYGKKSLFDSLSQVLKPEVFYTYYIPILTHDYCNKTNVNLDFSYSLTTEDLKYKGKGVYIGLVTADDVDYRCKALCTKRGESRIAYIWDQIRAGEGVEYLKEQIDKALASSAPGEVIKLPKGDSISTAMLGIAGGMSEEPHYKGVATEAEFIVAKVNTASKTLQRIYGGVPNEEAVTMPDVMVGIIKLMNFAKEQGKPLVLCIPFNTNIDPHDGSLILYEMLGLMAQMDYRTIIVPAGEEADKMHHFGLEGKQSTSISVNMRVQKENQNVVGVIYQRFTNIFAALLYPPPGVATEPINLKAEGVIRLKEATIYSIGYKISFVNGAVRILFRMDNPQVGGWRIEITSDTEQQSQIDIWISQQELNEYIVLSPASAFMTMGSTADTYNVMAVGGYDKDSMTVLRSSGRGYSWDNRVKPLFITHAKNIIAPCGHEQWSSVTGTLPAVSIMAGAVATLYSKFVEEKVSPFPNTLVMNSIILSIVRQLDGVEYPNQSQGYGIFYMQTLNTLLAAPFIL